MKQKWLLFSLLVIMASCTKQEPMEALIDRVFSVAEQQYVAMDARLDDKTMPQTITHDSTFKSSTIIGGAVDFIQVPFGIFMNIRKTIQLNYWLKRIL